MHTHFVASHGNRMYKDIQSCPTLVPSQAPLWHPHSPPYPHECIIVKQNPNRNGEHVNGNPTTIAHFPIIIFQCIRISAGQSSGFRRTTPTNNRRNNNTTRAVESTSSSCLSSLAGAAAGAGAGAAGASSSQLAIAIDTVMKAGEHNKSLWSVDCHCHLLDVLRWKGVERWFWVALMGGSVGCVCRCGVVGHYLFNSSTFNDETSAGIASSSWYGHIWVGGSQRPRPAHCHRSPLIPGCQSGH